MRSWVQLPAVAGKISVLYAYFNIGRNYCRQVAVSQREGLFWTSQQHQQNKTVIIITQNDIA